MGGEIDQTGGARRWLRKICRADFLLPAGSAKSWPGDICNGCRLSWDPHASLVAPARLVLMATPAG
jgi:hypothetical protein